MQDAKLADEHFAKLQEIGALADHRQPRALLARPRGRRRGRPVERPAVLRRRRASYPTAFYGQLGAARAGQTTITVGKDPSITAADRARFEDRPSRSAPSACSPRSAPRRPYKSFVLALAETLATDADAAQLVDLVRGQGDQYLSMKVVRAAAKHGFVLPERGYPLHATPGGRSVEVAYVLGITRQESGFDPHVRSPAGATGMMQLMPATARSLSHKYGYGEGSLEDADYNMQLGSAYLGQLMDQFGGSYVMADRRLQRRPRAADRVGRRLRRPADVVDRPGRLHRVHPVLGDPRLRDAGDGGDAGLPRAPRRRHRPS